MSKVEITNNCSQKVHEMFEQPPGWMVNSLPKANLFSGEFMQNTGNFETLLNNVRLEQEYRWVQETLRTPQDTHVTIIMPIHNEERCLPSALGALRMSDIPDKAKIQFVFFVNGCTDNGASTRIVEDTLSDIGTIEDVDLEVEGDDPLLNKTAKRVKKNNLEFLLVESGTASKTNALNIANLLANQRGDDITISTDANNWLEPDAIRNLIGTAYRGIDTGEAVLFGGKSMIAIRGSKQPEPIRHTNNITGQNESHSFRGWLMAWDTKWYEAVGGLPKIAMDDYTLSVLARRDKDKVPIDDNAPIWGYFPKTFTDKLLNSARAVRDKRQLRDNFRANSEIVDLIEKERPYTRNLNGRLIDLVSKVKKDPKKFPIYITRFFKWEFAGFLSSLLYSENINSQSWMPIKSTK